MLDWFVLMEDASVCTNSLVINAGVRQCKCVQVSMATNVTLWKVSITLFCATMDFIATPLPEVPWKDSVQISNCNNLKWLDPVQEFKLLKCLFISSLCLESGVKLISDDMLNYTCQIVNLLDSS